MWLAGSAAGNILRLGADVRDETARAIAELAVDEPPMADPTAIAAHLDEYRELLAADARVESVESGVTYTFPPSFIYPHDLKIVSSETSDGEALVTSLRTTGMPADLVELGFTDTTHFWPPWCMALKDAAIVSIAFTARLSSAGAEVGVVTVPASRGHGFAGATTAEWGSLSSLGGRALFYSTTNENVASQQVAMHLGLKFLGANLAIY